GALPQLVLERLRDARVDHALLLLDVVVGFFVGGGLTPACHDVTQSVSRRVTCQARASHAASSTAPAGSRVRVIIAIAARSSSTESTRRRGSIARARAAIARTSGASRSSGGAPAWMDASTAHGVSPANGRTPVISSTSITPSPN